MSWLSLFAASLVWTLQALPLVEETREESTVDRPAIQLTVSDVEQESPWRRP